MGIVILGKRLSLLYELLGVLYLNSTPYSRNTSRVKSYFEYILHAKPLCPVPKLHHKDYVLIRGIACDI